MENRDDWEQMKERYNPDDPGRFPEDFVQCDHGVPPDISWPNFVRYCRILAEMTGWM